MRRRYFAGPEGNCASMQNGNVAAHKMKITARIGWDRYKWYGRAAYLTIFAENLGTAAKSLKLACLTTNLCSRIEHFWMPVFRVGR